MEVEIAPSGEQSDETGVEWRGFCCRSAKLTHSVALGKLKVNTEASQQKATLIDFRKWCCARIMEVFCNLSTKNDILVVHYFLLIKIFSTIVAKMLVLTDVARSAGKENTPASNIPWRYEGGIYENCMYGPWYYTNISVPFFLPHWSSGKCQSRKNKIK